jgi:membrane associated rhomboid family serine protease
MVDFGRHLVNRDGSPVRAWKPWATYGLLGVMVVVWFIELWLANTDGGARYADYQKWFVVDTDWPQRPWSPLTSTMAHSVSNLSHLLFNGLFLFFMGPTVERILGRGPFVALFLLGGALSGIVQVHFMAALGDAHGALGASGGLMVLMGLLMILTPHTRLLVYGIIPVRLWIAGVIYAVIDVLGVFNPESGIGHVAHLVGLALGLGSGVYYKQRLRARGLRIITR